MLKVKTSQDKWNKNKIYLNLLKEIKCFKGFKLNISWLNVLWTIFHCSLMTLWWPTPVVCPSGSLSSAKPAGHTLSSINIFQTWPLYTDSYQIFHCVWMKGCSSAPSPPYTDSYQIFHCVWMKGCSSAPSPPYTDYNQIFHCVWMKGCSSAPPPLHWLLSDLPLCLNEGML